MALFKCSKCNCIENTSLGLYWSKKYPDLFIFDENNINFRGKALCSECAPKLYSDNKPTGYGIWHNKFPKTNITELTKEEIKNIYLI